MLAIHLLQGLFVVVFFLHFFLIFGLQNADKMSLLPNVDLKRLNVPKFID